MSEHVIENREMRIARASKKVYRAMQEFEATFEKVRIVVEETDTDGMADEIRRLAEGGSVPPKGGSAA